jgi:dolichol-phosphate mannosyltransferase
MCAKNMKLSIIIPAHNEEECVARTIEDIAVKLKNENIACEIVLVDDNSTDNTSRIAVELSKKHGNIRVIVRTAPAGFGRAVRDGLDAATGDAIAIVMADMSDDPDDIVKYFRKIEEGYDCVFGSRFIRGSKVTGYPPIKLFINRLANIFIQILFLRRENDITNAFKMYRKEAIQSCRPFLALYFNMTVELPLKAINRGFKIAQVPINWYGRKSGGSKLKISEMGRKYLFHGLYLWLEKILLKDELVRR